MFCVLAFFLKNRRKTCSKIETAFSPSKITKKSSPGTHFGTPNATELTSERSKTPKIREKSTFRSEQFFERLLGCKKAEIWSKKGRPGRRRRSVQKPTGCGSNDRHVRSRVVFLENPRNFLQKVRLDPKTTDSWPLAPGKWPQRTYFGTTVTTLRGV